MSCPCTHPPRSARELSFAHRRALSVACVPRVALIAVFIAVLLMVVIGGHLYLAEQLVLAPQLPAPWHAVALVTIALGGALLVAQPIAERLLRPARARWINWPASLWMGFAFLLLILSLVSDLAQVLVSAAFADASEASPSAARMWAAFVVVVGLVAGAAGVRTALREPTLERRELSLRRWPMGLDGFRIVQI